MCTVTIAVDLAKHVFEIAISSRAGSIQDRKRLSRGQFEQLALAHSAVWSWKRAPARISGGVGCVFEDSMWFCCRRTT